MGGPGGTTGLSHELLRRKPVGSHKGEHVAGGDLPPSIGLFQLSMFGVGATIGTGIFFVLSQAVPIAGPAVILVVRHRRGRRRALSAVCYAELASAVPVSGSSYSYAYAARVWSGGLPAAGVWRLLGAAVAVGWSGYLNEALRNLTGIELPHAILAAPWDADPGVINLPAVVLVALCALLPA